MGPLRFGALLGYRAALGLAGSRSAASKLIAGLGSEEEDVRVTSGMLLTRAGRRAEPYLVEALRRGENVPAILEVLGSIGDSAMEGEVERFIDDPDPRVARAAADASQLIRLERGG
ncbi:MAG TPA: hypothetical protein VGN08_02790 [Solirubrobacteraceae bacterium]